MAKESVRIARSRRRKHKFRMRRRARRAYPDWEKAVRNGDHIKMCSCYMCGNPRRFEKSDQRFTVAELCARLRQDDWEFFTVLTPPRP